MVLTLERTTVAKGRGRPRTERDDVTVKLDRAIVGKAKAVARHKGTTVAEMLSEILRVPVNKSYAAMLRELEGDEGEGN
jgi:hypothetical protein